ncbi:fibrillin-1 isoform X2 [Anabrus simplex]|uniref:fibrillin-1 isoform X2 n=1 Tax=Anabrus simplex TaxID=316456 RepID=UPI0035A2EEBA
MKRHQGFQLAIVVIGYLFPVLGDLEPIFTRCCSLGTNWATEGLRCNKYPAPVAAIPPEQQAICLSAVGVCCLNTHRKIQCEAGKEAAQLGNECEVVVRPGGEYHKDCCEGCKLGIFSGSMNMGCSFRDFSFGHPWDSAYRECCIDVVGTTTESVIPTNSTVADSSPADELPTPAIDSLCELLPGELCAQICIPTPGSYRCACRPGFHLLPDGKTCQQDEHVDRCKINNPCAHKCFDTGVAIECSCHPGYTLGKDDRSCEDIDECLLKIDLCAPNNLICRNEVGSYSCVDKSGAIIKPGNSAQPVVEDTGRCPIGYQYNLRSKVCNDIDECSLNLAICGPSDACQNTIGSYECIRTPIEECPPGYKFNITDQSCHDINECMEGSDNCDVGKEFCINTEGSFTCQLKAEKANCPAGYKFDQEHLSCEDVDECAENIHSCVPNKEICRNTVGAYECDMTCAIGFEYSRAHRTCVDVDECTELPNPCSPSEICVNQPGSFSCNPSCPVGFKVDPERTESCIDIDECKERLDFCNRTYETCKNKNGSYDCLSSAICPEGFRKSRTGLCEDINECEEHLELCDLNTEICVNEPGAYRCAKRPTMTSCPPGYKSHPISGECVDVDECVENVDPPCDSNQECVNTVGSYDCSCKKGFHFDPLLHACIDVNECQTNQHDCTSSQRCDNTIGSFQCIRYTSCGTGYTLNAQTGRCEDDDECALGTDTCQYLGPAFQCRNTLGSFRCERKRCEGNQVLLPSGECETVKCSKGYEVGAQGTCIDINECERNNPCKRNQRCQNTRGSYVCLNYNNCVRGYELNEAGTQCVDVDECARGTHECAADQICQNIYGSYICECPSGYFMTQKKECEDIDECTRYGGGVCPSNAICKNTPGSFHCACKDGFRQEGNSCPDIDECSESKGLCHHKCINVWGSYRCSCNPGYTLQADNRSCHDIDECEEFKDRKLCIGICVNEPGSYTCRCPNGYRLGSDGRTCQDINECMTGTPCQGRDEVCVNTLGGYRCVAINCPARFIKDLDHKNRCKRESLFCNQDDVACFRLPHSYSYNFIAFVSNLLIPPSGHLDLFTMRGLRSTATVSFTMQFVNARAPPGVPLANKEYFLLRRGVFNQGIISIVRPIIGPQEVELELVMDISQNGLYGSSAVAKLFIFVSEYSY